ncbi:MAG: T9SS type A sorting domain-containing protein [Bacteroidales bacterium]|nr:T9SS type A sorting domain-containing protein [Bacteroidales bacterium]
MKYYILTLLCSLLMAIGGMAQQRSYLIDSDIALFYAGDFNPQDILPSLTVKEEPDSIAPVPGDWPIIPGFTTENGKGRASISYAENTDLYGTGEGVGPLRRNGREVIMWNTDNYGYGQVEGKRLYQSHPWVMGVREDGSSFGILVDNTWKQTFFLNNPMLIESEGPPFRIFVIEKENPQEVVMALGELTGIMELPPLWSLGYHQCRYSYYPDTRVKEIADGFRSRNIPCDVIWVDIDYMDGFRVFTFDPQGFDDPEELNNYLHEKDFKSIYMIDPGVKVDEGYFVYDQGTAGDHWILNNNGNVYNGEVWPGQCAFPDYTRPETRDWWAGLYHDFMANGIDGVWNDMNEPAVFDGPDKTMPIDNIHRGGDGLPEDIHLRYHNVYGMLMIKGTRQGVLEANPEKRPFVLTRANYIGGNRFAATWTGDNNSSWDHFKMSIPMSLNLGLSGQYFNGPDIGGFAGSPSSDLLAHWMAVGAFYPFSRNHTGKGSADQEPWAMGEETEAASRLALNRRYRLMPHLYTLFREASQTGLPVMQPVFFADPQDLSLRDEQEVFLWGDELLIIPRWAENPGLPEGTWRSMSVAGEDYQEDSYQPKLKLRGGAIIPLAQPMQSTEGYSTDSVTLLVSPDSLKHANGDLYADAGNGFEYQNGMYALTGFEASPYKQDSLLITCRRLEGQLDFPNRKYRVGVLTNYGVFYNDWTADTNIIVPLPPEISLAITSPEDGQSFEENENILIDVEIDSEIDIQKVSFYRNDALLGEDMASPWQYNWSGAPVGIHQVYAVAQAADTIAVTSNQITIKVGKFGEGYALRQVWQDVPGVYVEKLTSIPEYPENPDLEEPLESLATPKNIGDNYGTRISGFIHPYADKEYTFSISGDDYCEFWLSTDSSFTNLELVAEVPGWSFPDEWSKYPEQTSEPVSLQKGQKYAFVVLQKEAEGDDFVRVGWETEENELTVIDGMFLSPANPGAIGVEERFQNYALNLSPNPADDQVKIQTGKKEGRLALYSISGKMLYSRELSGQAAVVIPTRELKSGIYFVSLETENGKGVEKLVVQH